MTAVVEREVTRVRVRPVRVRPARVRPEVAERPQGTRVLLAISLAAIGAVMAVLGTALAGSSWIYPPGMVGGGVALLVMAPFARGSLDVLVTLSPFMFYTLSPVGGILTVGSSDVLLPVILGALLVVGVVAPRAAGTLPAVPGAAAFLLISCLVVAFSIAGWTIADPDFLVKRAVADAAKLGIGVAYFIVTFLLARRGGADVIVRAFRIWAWTATGLSALSLAGITGAIQVIPSDGYRSNGYFLDPNLYAGYLLVSFAVVLFLATTSSSPWLPFQALMIVGGTVMTGSRAGLGSLLILIVLALVLIGSVRLRAMLLGVIGLSVAAAGWLLVERGSGTSILGIDRLFFASNDVNDDPRLSLWSLAVDKWLDAPLWGIGLGQFERFSGSAFRTARTSGLGYVTHNTFLFFLVAFGLVGLVLFLALIVWIIRLLYLAPNLTRNAKHALLSGIVVLCSQMMTLNLQNLRYVWVYFGLVLGLSLVGPRQAGPEPPEPSETPEPAT